MADLLQLIRGERVAPAAGAWTERGLGPDGGSALARVPAGDARDVERALAAARAAQPAWAARSPFARGDVLRALARALGERGEAIAALMSDEIGKPIGEARGELANAARVLDFYAGLAHELGGEALPSMRDGVQLFTRREPRGVVALVTPWNFPVNLPVVKLAPALLAGNAVVWKPASPAAASASAFADCFAAAGLPPGVANMVLGGGGAVGDPLLAGDVDAVSFTGSTAVGRAIERRAAERGVRALTELGGKNAAVVCADADLDAAVQAIVEGAFRYAGQKCTATSRAIVVADVHDAFVERLLARVGGLVVGPPQDAATFLGPLIAQEALDGALAQVREAVAAGARLAAGGARAADPGWYLEPTVLTDVTADMRIAREELFAPVLAVLAARDAREAFALADRTDYGLTAAIFTRDLATAFAFAERADVGAVQVNLPTAGLELQAPIGGRRGSGAGGLEQGRAALDFYTRVKTISVRHAEAP